MPESDYLIKALTKNGSFRAIAVSTKILTEEARERHTLSNTSTVALGRAFACAVLLCNTLRKTKGHLILKIRGNGPLEGITVDASNEGTIRGYVGSPSVECFDDNGYISVSKAVGTVGYVYVVYDNEKGVPHNGSVEIVSGEIAKDVVNYLALSEQIPSFITCGVYIDPKANKVSHAGGLLIQRLPDAKEEEVRKLEDRIARLDPFSILLRSGLELDEIVKKSLIDFEVEIISEFEGLCFHCGCNQKKFESALISMGKEELKKQIEDVGYAEGKCNFCSNSYKIDKKRLNDIFQELKN